MFWKNHSFSVKLFICIFTTSFVLLIVGGVVILKTTYQKTVAMNRTLTLVNIEVAGENIEHMFNRVDTAVQLAFYQTNVLAAVKEDYTENPSAKTLTQHALTVAVASDDMITHMSLCSEQNGVLSTQGTTKLPYHDIASFDVYYSGISERLATKSQAWDFLKQDPLHADQWALTNIRKITPGNLQTQLYLAVTCSEQTIAETYCFLGENSFLMTPDGTVISAVDKSMIGTVADEPLCAAVHRSMERCAFLFETGNTSYFSMYLSPISCYLIVATPAGALSTFKSATMVITSVVFLLGLSFSLVWAKYLAAVLTKPMMNLKSVMESAMDGNMDIRCEIIYQDEIGFLCNSFNHMMDNLNGSIAKLKKQQDLAKETEIRLLQSQINPHLLYNTLDSAIFLIGHHESDRSIHVLEALSSYFKMALQKGSQEITIQAALEHIRSYLRLQNLCRMKNYTLHVTCPPELLRCTILHMLLQPIVENAVLHGFDGNFADGTIDICIARDGEKLVITVSDDGMGMTDEELASLQDSFSADTPTGKGFALWNIAQRVRIRYGESYGLSVASEFGEYTKVTLQIPCLNDTTT